MAAVKANDLEAARKLMFDAEYDANKAIIVKPLNQFQERMNARAKREAESAQSQARLTGTIAQVMTLATAAAFLALPYGLFGRRVVAPLTRMSALVRRLAEGDYAVDIPDTARQDEIGDMSRAVRIFKDNGIAQKRLEAEQVVQRIRGPPASGEADFVDQLVQGFETRPPLHRHRHLGGDRTRRHRPVDDRRRREHQPAGDGGGGAAEETSANVQTVAAAAEELVASIQEIARQVQRSTEVAGHAVDEAEAHHGRDGQAWPRRPPKIGDVVTADHRHRRPDQPAGAQRHDRGGARRRGRQGLRGRRLRGEEPRHPDREGDRGDRRADQASAERDQRAVDAIPRHRQRPSAR